MLLDTCARALVPHSADGDMETDSISKSDFAQQLLDDSERETVKFAFSLHNAKCVADGEFRLHYVLKFHYKESIIPLFGKNKPNYDELTITYAKDGSKEEYLKVYGDPRRLFPYCLFNSLEEETLSWTFKCKNGMVDERIEILCTLSSVSYKRYYPFVLDLLCIKVGSDGTAQTGRLNLLPMTDSDGSVKADYGVFIKTTSNYRIKLDGNGNPIEDSVICKMVARDLTTKTLGNHSGIYTRVYTTMFFDDISIESFCKFILLSIVLMNTTVFLPEMDIEDNFSAVLTIVLTEVALLFVLPESSDFTTAESVIVGHSMYMIAILFGIHLRNMSVEAVLICNAVVTVLTIIFTVCEYRNFVDLVARIKSKFKEGTKLVGNYSEIDKEI